MREMIINFFNDYTAIIVFFHVISAVIWIGGMISVRFAVHSAMQDITEPKIKLGVSLKYIQNLLNIVKHFIGILIVTAIIMTIGFGFKGTPLSPIAHTKEAIWLIMTVIFIIIWVKRTKAQKFYDNEDFKNAKNTLASLSMFLIPANIILGVIAIYLGITLRGF